MNGRFVAAAVLLVTTSFFACSSDETSGTGGAGAGSSQQSSLPCDVAAVIATCTSCHATAHPSGGVRIAGRDDLLAVSSIDASQTVADRSIARMKDAASPMPPGAPLAADQIAVFEAWVAGGMPAGDCDGVGGAPPVEVVCTSKTYWMRGDEGSEDMHPGHACLDCHKKELGADAGKFPFAGTVFPTAHEEYDCNGIGGSTVVITEADGTTHTIPVRASGNFVLESEAAVAWPIRAEVRRDGKVAAMQDPVDSGDCNSCHTALGAEGAPGRITPP
ncbi:MAG: hypothetical protein JNL21_27785 [Myxococcales bacterium]|nr:hypothetical protein [Myxococcales bacterium]